MDAIAMLSGWSVKVTSRNVRFTFRHDSQVEAQPKAKDTTMMYMRYIRTQLSIHSTMIYHGQLSLVCYFSVTLPHQRSAIQSTIARPR